MSFLSRYSYLLVGLIVVAGSVGGLVATSGWESGFMVGLLVAAALVIFWVLARRGYLTPANPEKRIRRGRGHARPLVVHFYADLSLNCLVKRVMAARCEQQFRGQCEFLFIEAGHPEAERIAEANGAELGDFLLFDAAGSLFQKTGMISPPILTELLERPSR